VVVNKRGGEIMSRGLGLIFFALSLLLATDVWADPFLSYPGTRAKAMAGAFVAVADDSSACWYNPAGLATESFDLTLEFSQAPGFNDNREYSNEGTSIFLGFKGGSEKIGGGLFLYSPYSISYRFRVPDDSVYYDYLYGYLDETLYISGLVGALGNKFIKLGASLEMIYLDFGDSAFYGASWWGTTEIDTDPWDIFSGVSASFGVLLHPINLIEHGFDLRLGAVYHLPSIHRPGNYYSEYAETLANKVIFKKPSSYDVGVSAGVLLGSLAYMNFSAQYGEIDYSTANEYLDWQYQKVAVGGELRISLGKIGLLSLRGGAYYSEPSKDSIRKVSGVTGGIGLGLGQHFTLESSFERRGRPTGEPNFLSPM